MEHTIAITFDTESLSSYTDSHLATLWHLAQANPAPIEDRDAGAMTEKIGREIIRRFLAQTPPELWAHQGRHHYKCALTDMCRWNGEKWVTKNTDEAQADCLQPAETGRLPYARPQSSSTGNDAEANNLPSLHNSTNTAATTAGCLSALPKED